MPLVHNPFDSDPKCELSLGITIGYSLSIKAVIAVAQSLLLPLAFGGGLFLPVGTYPSWLDVIST